MSTQSQQERYGQLLRRFDLNLLIIFEALMNECHVTRAANKLCLSQPAVSHALSRMRQELGDPLLVRTDKGMQPTPRAQAMRPRVQQALKLLESSLTAPQPFDPNSSNRHFVIAATDYFELVYYPLLIAQLRQVAPNISVEIQMISAQALEQGLESRQVDLVIGLEQFHDIPARLISEPWVTDELICLASRNNRQIGTQLSLEDYVNQPQVTVTDLTGNARNAVDIWLENQDLKRRATSCNLSNLAAARIAALSDAIVTLPKQMAELFTQMLPVKLVTPPAGLAPMAMTLIHHPLYSQDPALQWLIEQIKRCTTERADRTV